MIKKIGKIAAIVLLSIFLISLIYVSIIRVSGVTPSVFGFSIVRVKTESMDPALNLGDVIVVQKVDPKNIYVNDIVTYRAEKGPYADMLVTHQVVEKAQNSDGSFTFITRGIKSDSVNDYPFDDSAIVGKALFKIPVVGTFYDFFSSWYGWLVIIALLAVAFGDDIYRLIKRIKSQNEELPGPDELKHASKPQLNDEVSKEIYKQADELLTDLDEHF